VVVLWRPGVGTGYRWGHGHCQKPLLIAGKVMQDLHGFMPGTRQIGPYACDLLARSGSNIHE
jgi:hypothetical protein